MKRTMRKKSKRRTLFSILFPILLLAGCASTNKEMGQRMDQWEIETREEVEALKRAVEASYDRERAMAERLRQTEEASAQMGQEMHVLREQSAAVRAQLDSLQPSPLASGSGTASGAGKFDVLKIYRVALDQYRNRQYQAALDQFATILDRAPYTEWADNAQYWKGECYYGLGKFRQALTEFTKVFAYQKTEKADDAQLKIARCYMDRGEKDKALEAFQKLLDEYPESEYVPRARKEIKYLQRP